MNDFSQGSARLNRKGGWTLTEMGIVGAIIGLMGLFSAVNYRALAEHHRRDRAVSDLVGQLREARMQAVSQNAVVEVTYDSSTGRFSRKADLDGNGSYSAGEITTHDLIGIQGVAVTWPATAGKFNSMGTFTSNADVWQIKVESVKAGVKYVQVYASGHVRQCDQSAGGG